MTAQGDFVLREATVLDESGGFTGPHDVVVRDGRIEAVEASVSANGADEHDFSGLWLMPGIVDCHEHVAMSSLDGMELLRTTDYPLGARSRSERSAAARGRRDVRPRPRRLRRRHP